MRRISPCDLEGVNNPGVKQKGGSLQTCLEGGPTSLTEEQENLDPWDARNPCLLNSKEFRSSSEQQVGIRALATLALISVP